MPKSKKQSQRSRSASLEKKVPKLKTEPSETERSSQNDEIFAQLQEMFSGQLDPDVVHMVLAESEWRVEEAIDTLFSLVGTENIQHVQGDRSSNKLFELASSILDTKSEGALSVGNSTGADVNYHTSNSSRPNLAFQTSSQRHMSHIPNEPFMSSNGNFSLFSHASKENEFSSAKPSIHNTIVCSEFGSLRSKDNLTPGSKTIASSDQQMNGYGLDTFDLHIPPKETGQPTDLFVKADPDFPSNTYRHQPSDNHMTSTQARGTNVNTANKVPLSMSSENNAMPILCDNDAILQTSQNRSCIKSNQISMMKFNSAESYQKTASLIDDYASGLDLRKSPECIAKVISVENNIQDYQGLPRSQPKQDYFENNHLTTSTTGFDSSMTVTKSEILNSISDQHLQSQKILFPTVKPGNCGIVSGLTGEEDRGSPVSGSWALSPNAPVFVPRIGNFPSETTANHQEYKRGFLETSEMSTSQMYYNNQPFGNRPWHRPTEKFSLGDMMQQSYRNASAAPKQSPQKSAGQIAEIEMIENYVKTSKKVLVILRGCPGSGKSTLAGLIKFNGVVLTTDDYFMRGNFYEYDQGLLGDAHLWNQRRSENSMKAGISPVIIDNTNCQKWEMRPYVLQALRYHYDIELMEPQTKWKFKARELAKRNSHGVGLESIERMLQRFEYHVTVEDIINTVQINQMPNSSQILKPLGTPSNSNHSNNKSNSTKGTSFQNDLSRDKSESHVMLKPPNSKSGNVNLQVTDDDKTKKGQYIPEPLRSVQDTSNNNVGKSLANFSETMVPDAVGSLDMDRRGSLEHVEGSRNLGAAITDNIITKGLGASLSGSIFSQNPVGKTTSNGGSSRMMGMFPGNVTKGSALENPVKSRSPSLDQKYQRNQSPIMHGSLFSPVSGSIDNVSNKNSDLEPVSPPRLHSQVDDRCERMHSPKPLSSLPSSTSSSTSNISSKVSDLEPISFPMPSKLVDAYYVDDTQGLKHKSNDLSVNDRPYDLINCPQDDPIKPMAKLNSATKSSEETFCDHRNESNPDKNLQQNLNSQTANGSSSETSQDSKEARIAEKVELGSTELDILAQLESDLSGVESESEVDEIVSEFTALVYFTSMEEAARKELERQLDEKVSLWKQEKGTNSDVTSAEKLESSSKTVEEIEILRKQDELPVAVKEKAGAVESSWDEPKPQRMPRNHSKSQEYITETQPSDVARSETGSQASETEDREQGMKSDKLQMKPPGTTDSLKSQRKRQKNKQKRPPSPFLDDSVKERFLTSAWSFPAFESSDSGEDSGGSNKASVENLRESVTKSRTEKTENSTNTSPRDFNILHLVNQGCQERAIEEEFKLLAIQKHVMLVSAGAQSNHVTKQVPIGARPSFDCSTSTDDLQEELNEKFALEFLQSCFKDVPLDDLKDILASCASDVRIAVNILLEWGYDSIDSPKEREKIALNRLQSTENEIPSMQSSLFTGATQKSQPLQLMDLCSKVLKQDQKFSDKYIECLLITVNQKRLDMVEKMTMQCERMLSVENTEGVDSNIWVKKGAVLCMYSDSEESESDSGSENSKEFQSSVQENGLSREVENAVDTENNANLVTEITDRDLPVESGKPAPRGSDEAEGSGVETISGTDSSASDSEAMKDISVSLLKETIEVLETLFGPVMSGTGGIIGDSRTVVLDHQTAKGLHSCLKKTILREAFVSESGVTMTEAVERTQRDESVTSPSQSKQKTSSKRRRRRNLDLPSLRSGPDLTTCMRPAHGSPRSRSPVSFREILDEETAKQLSKEEYLKSLEAAGNTTALSTRLNRKKLGEQFPGVDDNMLDEFFEANRYSLDDSCKALASVLGTNHEPQTVMTDEMAEKQESYQINLAKKKSLQDFQPRKATTPLILTSQAEPAVPVGQLEYHDFRAEAFTHHKLRQECFRKAQDAYSRGMKDVASFYSEQGHLHTVKLRKAHKEASEEILHYSNSNPDNASTIDLHGLHPDEAVYHLNLILQQRQKELSQSPGQQRCHLSIITGKGVHSRGRAKLKPAVINFLSKGHYSWRIQSSGVLQVALKG